MEGEGEEKAELWHHPQPFLQRFGIRTKQREQRERGGAKGKEMRRKDVWHNV